MELKSPIQKLELSQSDIFDFLSQVKNWEILMPEQNERFQVTSEESFNFQLKGMPEIRLRQHNMVPKNLISLASNSDKFEFYLHTEIAQVDENSAAVQFNFTGDFNPVMRMMVKRPLTNFIEQLSANLTKINNPS